MQLHRVKYDPNGQGSLAMWDKGGWSPDGHIHNMDKVFESFEMLGARRIHKQIDVKITTEIWVIGGP